MANKAFSAKARESSLAKIVGSHITDDVDLMNALDFIESPLGLGVNLYPVQRVLLKLSQGIPMDYREKIVPVHDVYGEELLYELPETEYIKYVFEQGRCNIPDWRDARSIGYNELCILVGRRGGKALLEDTPIPTPSGMSTMGSLQTGDWVFSPSGEPVKVKLAHEPFEDNTYEVFFDDGTSVVCHGGHLWQTYTKLDRKALGRGKSRDGSVVTTEDILKTLHYHRPDGKTETNHSVRLTSPVNYPEQDLPLDPYLLGLWLGDGAKEDTAFTTMDSEVASYLQEVAESYGLRLEIDDKKDIGLAKRYRLVIADRSWKEGERPLNPIREALREMGIWGNKSIPEIYLQASVDQRMALLQGLMDTDGCCSRSRCEFMNTNYSLAHGVYRLACSLGVKAFFNTKRATLNGKDCGEAYRVTWTNTLNPFKIARKTAQVPVEVKSSQNWRFITDIQPRGVQRVRCITVDNPDGLFLFGYNYNITHNSQLTSALTAYRLYKLLSIRDPQSYYQLVQGSPIDIVMMAQDEDGAGRLFGKLREDVLRSPFFATYLTSNSNTDLKFVTESDRNKKEPTPTIIVNALPCTTRAARGPSAIVLCLDEFAHFKSNSGANSSEVYDAATPSTLQFKHPDTGLKDSQIIIVTSPLKKVGKYYDIYKHGMDEGPDCSVLSFRCGTAEMNPRTPKGSLRDEEKKSPISFKYEFGGDFAESTESYVKTKQIDHCVDIGRANITHFTPNLIGHKYFWGFDLGMRKDASALAIAHWEHFNGKPCLIYDYIDRIMVGEGDYKDAPELQLEHILQWMDYMNRLLPCFKGLTDQHGGTMLVQLLRAYGIEAMDLVHLSTQINSKMYHAFKGLIDQGTARFPDYPKFISEVKLLEADVINKYQIRVQAPMEEGSHDDMADAAALAAMLAVDWASEEGSMEMIDLINNPAMANRARLLTTGNAIGMNLQYASLSDLRLLQTASKAHRMQMQFQTSGGDYIPRSSKYDNARRGRR